MKDELDLALSSEQPIEPSKDFANGVMRAVREAATAPPPIPFPWRRLLPGLAATGLLVVAVALLPQFDGGWLGIQFPVSMQQVKQSLAKSGAFWLTAGGLVSYLSVKLSLLSSA